MHRQLSPLAFAGAALVVAFQIACPLYIAEQGSTLSRGTFSTWSDAARYRAIVESPGRPYRDFDVEYPPGAFGVFKAVGTHDFGPFRQRLLWLQVACQALVVLLLFRSWGNRAGWSYLALSTPLLFVVYIGYDLIGVALAVCGAALIRTRRPALGAGALVLGAFTKLWPVVLIPSLLVRRQVHAFAVACGMGCAGLAAWAAWGGPGAIGQVLTYRGAHGWEYESVPGSLLRLFTGDPMRFELGAWRIGAPPHVLGFALTAIMLGVVAGVWYLVSQRPAVPEGLGEAAAVTCVLVFGTLLSPQFLIWPLPFVAIAAGAGVRKLERWAGAATVLTFVHWLWFDRNELVILLRNIALVGLLLAAILEIRRAPNPARDRQPTA